MRETKYRCWDGNNGLMWEVTDLQWAKKGGLIYIRGYFINKDGKKEGIGGFKNQMPTEKWNNLKLLEFIGDKIGGVEVYEGDIAKFTEKVEEDRGRTRIEHYRLYVVWENYSWVWYNTFEGYDNYFSECTELLNKIPFEIIGNIHKNPELLK